MQGGVLTIQTQRLSLEIMTKGNAQNNTDWGNEEYDNLIKEANGSYYVNLIREMKLKSRKYFTSRRTSTLYIKKVKHI